ncbi:hypothetical protein KAI32_03250 [Candidatus Pacearchaeota archaeon]|nr:hypothetical protein [Candidatus Pacearchaeota archaeon]
MECEKCKIELKEYSRFCPNCGEKVKTLEIKKDIGEKVIKQLKNILTTIESKKKEESKKHTLAHFVIKKLAHNH